jgi:hypothetical protein
MPSGPCRANSTASTALDRTPHGAGALRDQAPRRDRAYQTSLQGSANEPWQRDGHGESGFVIWRTDD